MERPASAFLILWVTGSEGRKSATAAAMSRTSEAGNSASHAAFISAAVWTATSLHAGGRRNVQVRAHQRHLGASGPGSLSQRDPHPSRGAISDEPDAVDRLPGSPGRDEHMEPGPSGPGGRRRESDSQAASSSAGFAQPADAVLAVRGQLALSGADDDYPALAQNGQVGLGGRLPVHVVVHGRRDEHRAGGGQGGRGEQVVRLTGGELGQRVSAGRRDQEKIGPLHQGQMADRHALRRRVTGVGPAQRIGLPVRRPGPGPR